MTICLLFNYMASGALAGIAAAAMAGVSPRGGIGRIWRAAAVIGGASLAGRQGGIGTAVLGGVFVTALANGMDLLQIGG